MKFTFFILLISLSLSTLAQDYESIISFGKVAKDYTGSSTPISLNEFKLNYINSYENQFKQIEIEKVSSLPNGSLAQIKPVLDGDKSYIRISVTNDLLKNEAAYGELAHYVTNINQSLGGPANWMEMATNARLGSVTALESMAKFKEFSLNKMFQYSEVSSDAVDFLRTNYESVLSEEVKSIEKESRAYVKEMNTAYDERRVIFDELDNADKQLKDLVMKNDREGVAKLVETYMPWEKMEPIEKKYWSDWLDAVRNPVPVDERVYVLRGMQGSDYFKNVDGKPVLLSPVIIKNQGTYNRRLRSLTTMMEKWISTNNRLEFDSELSKPEIKKISRGSRLSTQFQNHASDPKGSPYMSFTKNYGVARNFTSYDAGDGRAIGLFALDPRTSIPNYMSRFEGEIEILNSLVVFPDESLGFVDLEDEGSVKKLLQKEFGDTKGAKIYKREFVDSPLAKTNTFYPEAFSKQFKFFDSMSVSDCDLYLSP